MRWALVAVFTALYFIVGVLLTARAVGGIQKLQECIHTNEAPTKYLLGAMAFAVVTAVAINPMNERSFEASDWIRTGLVVLAVAWPAKRALRRETS